MFQQMVPLTPRDAAALRDFAQAARDLLGPELIELRLFGSKARGDDQPDSDIDVAVIVRHADKTERNTLIDRAIDVSSAHGVYVSARVIPIDIFRHPVWRLTGFLQAVEREGILVP